MSYSYNILFFHKNGKPRGWVRRVIFRRATINVPRKIFKRVVFKKNGSVRENFLTWLDEKLAPMSYSTLEPEPVSLFLTALAASNGTAYKNAEQWFDYDRPDVSIIILNWNNGALTTQCLHEIWKHTAGITYEIVVLDNGSESDDLRSFVGLAGPFRLIRLHTNRMFGEGNNIAAEAAKGQFLLFLNNDAFVTPGWMAPLVKAIQEPFAGAAGPMFVYPDGKLQECGAFIDSSGDSKQRGRGLAAIIEPLRNPQAVHYISAACLMVRKQLFEEVDGFSLDFEPAYYEDADLCFRIRKLGYEVRYTPDTKIIHIGNYSHREIIETMHKGIALNQQRFVYRHRDIIGTDVVLHLSNNSRATDKLQYNPPARRVGLYTPFALTPGGGTRYVLSLATVLSKCHDVFLVTPESYSAARLRQLGKVLDLDLSRVAIETWDDSLRRSFDIFVSMGNQIVPDVPARAPKSFYLCQFPFPIDDSEAVRRARLLAGYDRWLAYSGFAKGHIEIAAKRIGLPLIPVTVIAPPCPLPKGEIKKPEDRTVILSVGRFFRSGHCKNHHILVQAFRKLIEIRRHERLELHIAGSVDPHPESLRYFHELELLTKGSPITLHPYVNSDVLGTLYAQAHIYWQGTGMDRNPAANPEAMEHFGISVVEAMGAGCVPMAFAFGGPAEIITDGKDGCLYRSVEDLIESTMALLGDRQRMTKMAASATAKAVDFSMDRFSASINGLIGADVDAN